MTVQEVYETWINGNISDAKREVKKMSKKKFVDFIECCRCNGVMPYRVRELL